MLTSGLTRLCHLGDVGVLLIRHEAEGREDGKASNEAGATVQKAQVDTVPTEERDQLQSSDQDLFRLNMWNLLVTVVVVFIVAAKCREASDTNSV